jgi:hypothetical protein
MISFIKNETDNYKHRLPTDIDNYFECTTILNYQNYFKDNDFNTEIEKLKYTFFIKKKVPTQQVSHNDDDTKQELYYYDGINNPELIKNNAELNNKLKNYFENEILRETINYKYIKKILNIGIINYDQIKGYYDANYINKINNKDILKKIVSYKNDKDDKDDLSKVDFYIDFNSLDKFKIDNFNRNKYYFDYFYNNVLAKLYQNTVYLDSLKGIKFNELEYNNFLNEIQNTIISIIKVNNKNNTDSYNKYRYKYEIANNNILNITYCDDKETINDTNIESTQNRKKYIFGNFTHIFDYGETNKDIVNNAIFDKMIKNLNNQKFVFIIGYGSSGSGKTSTLIKFHGDTKTNKPASNGIITELCNRLGKENKILTLKIKEFYEGKNDNFHKIENYKFFFNYDEVTNNYKLSNIENDQKQKTMKIPILHYSRFKDIIKFIQETKLNIKLVVADDLNNSIKIDTGTIISENKNYYLLFTTETLFADILTIMVDLDRFVKATTNNPQSSRSHTLIFLDFYEKKDLKNPKTVIVGDFAGVENLFECNDPFVINAFQDIKKYNTTEKFYSKLNSYNNKFDVIYNGKETNDGMQFNENDFTFKEIPKQIKEYLIKIKKEKIIIE